MTFYSLFVCSPHQIDDLLFSKKKEEEVFGSITTQHNPWQAYRKENWYKLGKKDIK